MSQDQKRRAAEAAAALVNSGMTVGLGTGSTAALFVEALAARRLDITAVATSIATADQARELGIALKDLDDAGTIDLLVDGADEIGPGLDLIKGAGGALLREKLVWMAAGRRVVIADATKRVDRLGGFLLPVEVVAFGHRTTAARLAAVLETIGAPAPVLRMKDGEPLITDNGNLTYDAACGAIAEPSALAATLKAIVGVVEHGLFIGLADQALIGTEDGIQTIIRSE